MRYTVYVRKYLIVSIVLLLVLGTCAWWLWLRPPSNQPGTTTNTTSEHASKVSSGTVPSFDKSQFSLTDASSIWVIVNKQHPLSPLGYVPGDLTVPNVSLSKPGRPEMQMRSETATALEALFSAADKDGVKLSVLSAYRSYDYQVSLYNGYVSKSGAATADQESARPGYSEHQTGLAVDISAQNNNCNLEACFGSTAEGEWLATNAYKYGFLLRYPADKTAVTGYEYEPWHFRYVGTALSTELQKQHIETLEEFFGVAGGTEYK